jgi:hypothetical protein
MKEPEGEIAYPKTPSAIAGALMITTLATVFISFFPSNLLRLSHTAVQSVMWIHRFTLLL